ncbi:hypothetical protein [Arthrobacter globiformis]|uniref:hypothetical protein n=1 Tax=Arthrobacter globiformis TaxID=1665 RepID=UPI00277D1E21|nr:hypothetical protein [Arthrobacter globiformis]MDQ0866560.1 hypothetical protein [Arthrobacter globiformis]
MGEKDHTRASGRQNLPGAKPAVVAFVLTVLLGIGATSAAGLWQQSATATLGVSAATDWPAAPMSVQCTAGPGDSVTLTIQNIPAPTAVTIASRASGGTTYGSGVPVSPASATIVVSAVSYGIPDSVGSVKNGKIDLRVSATYTGGPGTAEILGLQLTGNNTRLACQ